MKKTALTSSRVRSVGLRATKAQRKLNSLIELQNEIRKGAMNHPLLGDLSGLTAEQRDILAFNLGKLEDRARRRVEILDRKLGWIEVFGKKQ